MTSSGTRAAQLSREIASGITCAPVAFLRWRSEEGQHSIYQCSSRLMRSACDQHCFISPSRLAVGTHTSLSHSVCARACCVVRLRLCTRLHWKMTHAKCARQWYTRVGHQHRHPVFTFLMGLFLFKQLFLNTNGSILTCVYYLVYVIFDQEHNLYYLPTKPGYLLDYNRITISALLLVPRRNTNNIAVSMLWSARVCGD